MKYEKIGRSCNGAEDKLHNAAECVRGAPEGAKAAHVPPRTEIVFILDASGSMYHLTNDTIGGFNALLDKNRDDPVQPPGTHHPRPHRHPPGAAPHAQGVLL